MAECSATAFAEHSAAFRYCRNFGKRLGTPLCLAEVFECGPSLKLVRMYHASATKKGLDDLQLQFIHYAMLVQDLLLVNLKNRFLGFSSVRVLILGQMALEKLIFA